MARARTWAGWTWDAERECWYAQHGTVRVVMNCAPDDRPIDSARSFTVEITGNAPRGNVVAAELEALAARFYADARASVDSMWGHPKDRVGAVAYRAMIGAELLRLCAWQDEDVLDKTVRLLAVAFWERLRDDEDVNQQGGS
jgi:hypothetical protein